MKLSTDRILTTHVGSLPRPQDVVDFLFAQDRGEPYDERKFEATMRHAVEDAVAHQSKAGIDIMSDGEMSKISYATYIRHRFNGFETGHNVPPRDPGKDLDDFPDFRDKLVKEGHSLSICVLSARARSRSRRWNRCIKISRARRLHWLTPLPPKVS